MVEEHKNKTDHSYLLRRTFREDGKVKHGTLGNTDRVIDAQSKLAAARVLTAASRAPDRS